MLSLHNIFNKISNDEEWAKKLIIGSLLSFIPIVNLFALGYIYRFAKQISQTHDLTLPDWTRWDRLFFDGIKFFIVFIVYFFLPVLLGFILSHLISLITLGILGPVAFFPLTISCIFAPPLMVIALCPFLRDQGFESLLDIKRHFQKLFRVSLHLVIPSLAFNGLLIIGFPLYGCAIFLGFLYIIAYTFFVFVEIQSR